METIDVTTRKYGRVPPYGNEGIVRKLRPKDDRCEKDETDGSWLVYNGITINMKEVTRAADTTIKESSASSFTR